MLNVQMWKIKSQFLTAFYYALCNHMDTISCIRLRQFVFVISHAPAAAAYPAPAADRHDHAHLGHRAPHDEGLRTERERWTFLRKPG